MNKEILKNINQIFFNFKIIYTFPINEDHKIFIEKINKIENYAHVKAFKEVIEECLSKDSKYFEITNINAMEDILIDLKANIFCELNKSLPQEEIFEIIINETIYDNKIKEFMINHNDIKDIVKIIDFLDLKIKKIEILESETNKLKAMTCKLKTLYKIL